MGSGEVEKSQPGPGVGEHTDEILRQYGYSEEEILELHSCGGVQ